ncbi:MAG: hypothetical protein HFJ52_08870 [Clostridia bacterium]|nr:hypothetical protein [Clostridia bacterium]
MTGIEWLKEQVKDQKDLALKQTVDYLLNRDELQEKYLQEDKTVEGMAQFIRSKGTKYLQNGWNYITNEVVYAWAVMYYSLPNEFLKIKTNKTDNKTAKKGSTKSATSKNNIISLDAAKQKIEQKKEVEQISLFGGVVQ